MALLLVTAVFTAQAISLMTALCAAFSAIYFVLVLYPELMDACLPSGGRKTIGVALLVLGMGCVVMAIYVQTRPRQA